MEKGGFMREFTVVIEQDEEGYYIAEVPELKGYHTQARSLDERKGYCCPVAFR